MHYQDMNCATCRELLSARLDGEDAGLESGAAEAHLAGCPACQTFLAQAGDLGRLVRVRPAEQVPDQTAAILARIGAGARPSGFRQVDLRVGLAIVGLLQLVLALPALLLGQDAGAPVHVARELGSFDAALAVGFVLAARRPARAAGLLPVVAALAACLVATAGLDVAAGRTPAVGETIHLLDLIGLGLLWRLAAVRPGGTGHALPD